MNKTTFREIRIKSFDEILKIIQDYENLEFFRGQSNSKWKILPKLSRLYGARPRDSWENLEYFMIEQFRQYLIPYLDKEPINDVEWLVLGHIMDYQRDY
jgi:hypothetical protein